MSAISDFLIEKSKDLLVSTAKEVIYKSKDIVVEKTTELVEAKLSEVKDNFEHKIIKSHIKNSIDHEIEFNNEIESNIKSDIILNELKTEKDCINEYKRIFKKRIVNNSISASTEHFLKLERERLNISEDLAEEIQIESNLLKTNN